MARVNERPKKKKLLDIKDYLETLNHAFAVNYTSLRAANMKERYEKANKSPALKELSESWLQEKEQNLSEGRQNFYDIYNIMHRCLQLGDSAELNQSIKNLIEKYNAYYNKNITNPDEIINGYQILDYKFSKDIKMYNERNMKMSSLVAIAPLATAYKDYLSNYNFHERVNGYYEMFEALKNDLDFAGNPTFTYQNPSNPNIFVINRNKILEFLDSCEKEYIKAKSRKLKQQDIVASLKERYEKNPDDKQLEKALNIHQRLLNIATLKHSNAKELCNQAILLGNRITWANTSKHTLFSDLQSSFYDLISGIPKSVRKENYYVDSVYVHKTEIQSMRQLTNKDSETSFILNTIDKSSSSPVFSL